MGKRIVAASKETFNRLVETPEFQEIKKSTKSIAEECVKRLKVADGKVLLAHSYQEVRPTCYRGQRLPRGENKLDNLLAALELDLHLYGTSY